MKLSKISFALGLAGMLGASAAFALPVSSAIPGGQLLFSDNSAEYMISRDGNATLDVGDSLRGIFSIDNITGSGPQIAIGTGTIYNELTGIFQVMVTSKTLVTPAIGPNPARYNYTFGFDNTFGQGAGVLGVLYDDPAQNFARTNCGTFANCEATATGGSLWATVGLGADGFWTASNAIDNPGAGSLLPPSTPLGSFSMALDFITNNTGYDWNSVLCADTTNLSLHTSNICGQGGLLATGNGLPTGGLVTPYSVFDNVDFTMNRVPEPSSLALLGIGLLGFAGLRRRKD